MKTIANWTETAALHNKGGGGSKAALEGLAELAPQATMGQPRRASHVQGCLGDTRIVWPAGRGCPEAYFWLFMMSS